MDKNAKENKKPKWKEFESIIAKIQSELSPDASVELNKKIEGRRSEVDREIDILVTKKVGQFDINIAIDCKDYSNPLNVKKVEEFIGLVEDVGANKGAIVAANGFTQAAKRTAQKQGIDLYTLVDAEKHDWQSYITIPVVHDYRSLGRGRFSLRAPVYLLKELEGQSDLSGIPLYDKDKKCIGTPLKLVYKLWNEGKISENPGNYIGVPISQDEQIFIRSNDGKYEPVVILSEHQVIQKLYYGQVPLTQFSALRDELSGQMVMPSKTTITTDFMDSRDVEENWLHIPSLESLAVIPLLTFIARDMYPL